MNSIFLGSRRAGWAAILLSASLGFSVGSAAAADISGKAAAIGPAVSPAMEISPEGVQQLAAKGVPYLLLNADRPDMSASPASGVRRIYYTLGPSSRAARQRVLQERQAGTGTAAAEEKLASQRLTGTPLDWQAAGLKLEHGLPLRPLAIAPRQLGEALKDGVDLQLVDLRADRPGRAEPSLPGAMRILPHQLEADSGLLAKRRWVVLVDAGDRVAAPVAEHLFAKGYSLIAVLDGGYPAWIDTTDR